MPRSARSTMDGTLGRRWVSAVASGACSLDEAVAGQAHGVEPPSDEAPPSYASLVLDAEMEAAWDGEDDALRRFMAGNGLSRGEYERLLAAGVDRVLLGNLNIAGDLGAARVSLSADGSRFAPEGPDPRLLLGVRDAHYQLVDLVALASHDENQWSLLTGFGELLGGWTIEEAHAAAAAERHFRLRLFATPWDWLRGGGRGICVLDWSGSALAELRLLGTASSSAAVGRQGGVTLVVAAGHREHLRAMLQRGGLPLVVEDRETVGRVA